MVNARRLYLYSVMGAALVPLVWGLSIILRLAGRAITAAVGTRQAVGAENALDELSLAIALVLVAAPIWLIHAWLAQRALAGPPAVAADERAAPARATYFFLVLTIAGGMALLQLYATVQEVLRLTLTDGRSWGLAGAVAATVVTAATWLAHLWWRRSDLLAAPRRTADDWLTRAYLYSGLFILGLLLALWIGTSVSVVLGELIDARPRWEDPWQFDFIGPAAGVIGAAVGWTAQWLVGRWLLRASPPLGPAHRASRTRTGYFLATVLASAAAVLFLLVASLRQVFAEVLGVWLPEETDSWLEAVAGPLVVAVPFALAWLWHQRRATFEALAFGGPERLERTRQSAVYVIAFVGLGGLAIGVALGIQGLLAYADAAGDGDRSMALRDDLAPALAATLLGLAIWAPAWRQARRDLADAPARVAASLQRRTYLLVVSGFAVVALMGSLALLAYQLISFILDAGSVEGDRWALAVAVVSSVVLVYHLWRLHLDGSLVAEAPADESLAERAAAPGTGATIEVSVPAGHDPEDLADTIRERLPEGADVRVLREGEPPGPSVTR